MKPKPDKAIPKYSLEWLPKSKWGPIKWVELHCRALSNLPMEGEGQWFESFVQSLPCPKCRSHFDEYVKDHPPDFTSRAAFFRWSWDAHNVVNFRTRKDLITLGEAYELHKYEPDPQ